MIPYYALWRGRKRNDHMNNKNNTVMNKQDSGIIGLLRQHWVGVAVLLLIYDAIAVNVSFFAALWVRFDCRYSIISSERQSLLVAMTSPTISESSMKG